MEAVVVPQGVGKGYEDVAGAMEIGASGEPK